MGRMLHYLGITGKLSSDSCWTRYLFYYMLACLLRCSNDDGVCSESAPFVCEWELST